MPPPPAPRPAPAPRPPQQTDALLQAILDAITNPSTMPGPNPWTLPGPNPWTLPGPNPQTQPGPNPQTQPGPNPQTQPGPNPQTQPGPNPQTQPAPNPQTHSDPNPPTPLKDLVAASLKGFATSVNSFTAQAEVDDYRIGQLSRRHLDDTTQSIQSYRERIRDLTIGTGMSHDEVYQYAQTAGRYGAGTGRQNTFDSLTQAKTSAKMSFVLGANAENYNDTISAFGRAGAVGASGQSGGFTQDQRQFAVVIAETLASGKLFDRLDEVLSSMTNLASHIASRGGDVDPSMLGRALASANNTAREFGGAKLQERAPDLLSKIDQTTSNLVNDPAAFAVYNRMHPSAAGNVGIQDMRAFRRTMEGGDIIEKSRVYGGLYELHGGNLANLRPGGKLSEQDMIAQHKLSQDYGMTTDDYENTLRIASGVSSGTGMQRLNAVQGSSEYQQLARTGSAGAVSTYARVATSETKDDLAATLQKLITNVSETPGAAQLPGSKESLFVGKLTGLKNTLDSSGDPDSIRNSLMSLIAGNESNTSSTKVDLDVGNRLNQSRIQTVELNEAFMKLAGNVNQLNSLLEIDRIKATAMRVGAGSTTQYIDNPGNALAVGTGTNQLQRLASGAAVQAIDKGADFMEFGSSFLGSASSASTLLDSATLKGAIGRAPRLARAGVMALGAAGTGYAAVKALNAAHREFDDNVTYVDEDGKNDSWKTFASKHEALIRTGVTALSGITGAVFGGPATALAAAGVSGLAMDYAYDALGINKVKRLRPDGSSAGGGDASAPISTDTGTGIVSIEQTMVNEMRVSRLVVEGLEIGVSVGGAGGGWDGGSGGGSASSVRPPLGSKRVSGPGSAPGSSPSQYSAQYANWRSATGKGDDELNKYVDEAAEMYGSQGVTRDLLFSMMASESGFNPGATSSAGAQGLMQLMPQYHKGVNAYDPHDNIMAGAKHIAGNLAANGGDMEAALAAYNGGQGNVNLPSARGYARRIMGRMDGTSIPSGGGRNVASPIAGQEGVDWSVGTPWMANANDPRAAAYYAATGNAYNWGVDLIGKGKPLTAQAAIGGTISKVFNEAPDTPSGINNGQSNINSGWGNQVEIRGDDGTIHRMSHLAAVQQGLKVGDRIEAGAKVGMVGATGRATGPHLDWEVLKNGKQIDAMEWLHNAQANGAQITTGGSAVDGANLSNSGSAPSGPQRLEIQIKLSQDKDGNIVGKVEGSTSININLGGDTIRAAQSRSGLPTGWVRRR